MSWTAHVTHGYTAANPLSQKFPGVWEKNLTSAHLAGTDGTAWGHHGDPAHNFTMDDINKLKGANPGSMITISIGKMMCIQKFEDTKSLGFKFRELAVAIHSGNGYHTIVVAADNVPNCIEAVEAFGAYLKTHGVE